MPLIILRICPPAGRYEPPAVLLLRGPILLTTALEPAAQSRKQEQPPLPAACRVLSPFIALPVFAGIVTADAAQQQPLGVLHLLAGVQAAAQAQWNASHPDQSLGLVALDLDLSPSGAALLSAPTAGGGVQRLRARRVSGGAIELLPRDGPPTGPQQVLANAVALQQEAEGVPDGPWPLKSVHPAQLQVKWSMHRTAGARLAGCGGTQTLGRQ